VPGLTQKPIQPDGVFKYGWHADTYGSYFYHAHSRGQIDDGAYGPIVIRPRAGILKPFNFIPGADFDELEEAESNSQPLLLTDWRHRTSDETWNDQMASGIESAVCMDSLLVNGRGVVECLSREDIDAAVDPGILPLLTQNGLKLTNKG
jgi:FtsP/CotA-like multicopper oxidase with cupredoxin domain